MEKLQNMKMIFMILAMVTISFQGTSQTYTGDQKEIDQILENISRFSEYVVNSNYDKIGESYTIDGKIFPSNTEIIEGKEKIIEYWKLPEGVRIISHKSTPSEIKIIGNEAYDYGYYEGITRRKDGEEVSWKGKYVIVWKKDGKDWKMYLDIWNRVNE